jgi:hypothetical protein
MVSEMKINVFIYHASKTWKTGETGKTRKTRSTSFT